MHVTDIAINQELGMKLSRSGSEHILEMPESPLLLNHIGTIHASAQFALAEACSGELLLRYLSDEYSQVFAVLRSSEVKFRRPAHGILRASGRFAADMDDSWVAALGSRGRVFVSVLIEIVDAQKVMTMTGRYDWFLQRQIGGQAMSDHESSLPQFDSFRSQYQK